MSMYRGCVMLRRRAREARAVAALGLVCGLAVLAGSAGCGADARVTAATLVGRPAVSHVVKRATSVGIAQVAPAGAQPTKADARPVGVSGVRDVRMGGGARLYAVSPRWRALLETGRELGGERIVLASSDGRRARVVLDGAIGRRKREAITGVRLSDSRLVWEEASQYDLELGGAAKWRLFTAPIVGKGPTLGAARVIDSGVVAQRPRCDFAVSGSQLAIASTRLSGSAPSIPRASLTIVDLVRGTRRKVLDTPGSADAVSWDGDRIVVTVTDSSRARRATAIVLDSGGRPVGRARLARGLAFAGPATARGDLVAASVTPRGSNDGELFVFSSSGFSLWKGGAVACGPQWLGERLVFLRPVPANKGGASQMVLFDPISGAERTLEAAGVANSAARVPVLVPGSAADNERLVYGLEPFERSVSGDEVTVIRSCVLL